MNFAISESALHILSGLGFSVIFSELSTHPKKLNSSVGPPQIVLDEFQIPTVETVGTVFGLHACMVSVEKSEVFLQEFVTGTY